MKAIVERIIIYSLRVILHTFYIFPVKKNRILFSAHEGKAYNCNPKYIFEALYRAYGLKYEYIWCLNDSSLIPSNYSVHCVKYLSVGHIYYSLTSNVIINDVGIEPFLPKRKKQLFINTWHGGGAYKKGNPNAVYKRNLRSNMTNYVISSCRKFSEVCSAESFFNIDIKRFLPIGMPRNDLFFHPETFNAIRRKICDLYAINEDSMIVLYAPTFRGGDHSPYQGSIITDIIPICEAIRKRFNRPSVVLYRCHIGVSFSINNAIDVNGYQDMQDLLIASDILLTDYSSSIWDYSLMTKPCFLFTPDVKEYRVNPGFHIPIEEWQYPYATTIKELCQLIENYDEDMAIDRVERHHRDLGSYEQGKATEEICKIICQHLDGNV